MSVDWQEAVLGDIATFSQGLQVPVEEQSLCYEEGLGRFIRIIDYTNEAESPRYIEKPSERYYASSDDVVMVRYGSQTAGKVVRGKAGYIANNMFKINLDSEFIDKGYLYYFLASNEVYDFLRSSQSSSTMPAITFGMLKPIIIRYPSLELQRKIASIIDEVEKKIELNRQTNQTLEHIAQAIFKNWFVDFEPTRAKIIAKEKGANTAIQELAAQAIICGAMTLEKLEAITQNLETTLQQAINEKLSQANQTPINTEQLKTTAALFPNALVESDGVTNSSETSRLIPEGWEVQTLEDVIELAYGKALKKTVRVEGDFPVYGSGGLTGTHNDALVEGPGVIVGRKGTVGSLYWEDSSFYPIDTVFYVKPKSSITLVYAYSLLQTLGLADMNTDAAVPGLNRNNVYRLDIVKPPEKLILIFSKLIGSFRERLSLNKQESKFLVEVRDLLLPKLLSGDLPI